MSSSYIGRSVDAINNISTLDNLSFNGSLQTFNLTQNGVAFTPISSSALNIQIDGIIQANNFTISGSTLTFDFVPSASSVCNSVKHFGVGLLTTVSDSSITTAKLGADSVNGSKIADDSISDEHLDITAITGQTEKTSLADADKFLISDSASSGALKYVEKQYLPSGDLVKLGTVATDNSNVSALTIDNCFSSTYDLYRIVGFHNVTSGGAHNYFRWRTGGASGSSYTTGDYQWMNNGRLIKSDPATAEYANWNYTANHGRVASDIRSDSNSAYVIFDLLVSDPNTNVMSRGFVTGTSAVRQNTDQRFVAHHVGITNGANVNATGFQMTVSTGSISYGRVSVYGMKQA